MIYHYVCNKCGKRKDVEFPMGKAQKYVDCDCGEKMTQEILAKRIMTHLPEDYIATSEYHSINCGDDSVVEYACNN